jgi:hypothetical protein
LDERENIEFNLLYSRIVAVLGVRPKVPELVFQVYGRPLHPELFQVVQSQRIQYGPYRVQLEITTAGHVITWSYEDLTLTEVATSSQHPLPERRRLISCRLREPRRERVECRGGVLYEVQFQLEQLSPEEFWTFQQQMDLPEEDRQGLFYKFASNGRIAVGAVSYIHPECRRRSFRVRAFHTFPDDYAIVKTESLFQLP